MPIQASPIELVVGYHVREPITLAEDNGQKGKSVRHVFNTLNVIGLIPIIGGIARLVFALIMYKNHENDPHTKAFYATMIMRASVELIGLGVCFLPIDIIFTVGRALSQPPASQVKAKPLNTLPPKYHVSHGAYHQLPGRLIQSNLT